MSDPIHYRAWGQRGLAFDCYARAINRHLADPSKQRSGVAGTWSVGKVPATTSVDKVTCLNCLRELRGLLARKYPA